jgi:hypothetical protein
MSPSNRREFLSDVGRGMLAAGLVRLWPMTLGSRPRLQNRGAMRSHSANMRAWLN